MAKTFTCKDCGQNGFTSAWDVRHHKEDKHGLERKPRAARKARTNGSPRQSRGRADAERPKRKYQRRANPAVEQTSPVAAGEDAEAKLLCTVLNAFANAETDRDADFRVLEYVALRFGPAAYEDEEK